MGYATLPKVTKHITKLVNYEKVHSYFITFHPTAQYWALHHYARY
jgi:hypothetical protein